MKGARGGARLNLYPVLEGDMKPLEGTHVLDPRRSSVHPVSWRSRRRDHKSRARRQGRRHKTVAAFPGGVGAVFLNVNRNKRSLALDLKRPESRSIVRSLVEKSGIVIESFAGGVTERLGIDYETLRSINPKIIYCSVSGYGRSGPMKDARGYDLILQAYSGILSVTGHPGSGRPECRCRRSTKARACMLYPASLPP